MRSEECGGSGTAGRFAGGKLTTQFTRRRDREKVTFHIVVTTLTLFISRLERDDDKMDYIEVANRKSLEAFIEEHLPER
jgi:hypothetical protein